MSKLERVIQRVFGEDGGAGEFGEFGSNAASPPGTTTKDLTDIQSLSQYLDGWYAATVNAGEPPRIQDRNALDLLFSSQLKYLFQNGIPEWLDDSDQLYYENISFVTRSGSIYQAIKGDDGGNTNAEKDPLTEPLWWKLFPQPNTAAAAIPAHYERDTVWEATNHDLSSPNRMSVNINATGYLLDTQLTLDLDTTSNWDDDANKTPGTRAGTDFYIYACEPASGSEPDIVLSANSSTPDGYDADDSRKIGGFHCLCVTAGTDVPVDHTL